ncbi:MAG: ATP-binding cassette domain-containing protein [Acidobacteria bacterium]|nr:ATP-binding cassette domain-containing protein [Acidobacteriota bacterium]MCG3191140.1 putative ABC transporter ATP-binding protein YbiT [Thermoanaerobaculia bacterium]MCK6683197.1 ATP-binding cassette domain-containing protein [Thermoanaerobaculia bacterium]
MIAISDLSKSFGARTLFSGVSIQFNPGNRYGLVGANGSGKSTLLKILSGEESPSGGQVSIPKRLRLGVLEQDHFQYESFPIIEVAMMGNSEVWQAMTEKERLLHAEPFDGERYAELEDVILRNDGYSLEARAAEVLEGLGIPTAVHRDTLSTLSGGFKLRVLLAQVLASGPGALLLDEPTNHLDIVSIRWLEKFLEAYKGLAIVISHDHRFLDNVCTHIADVDYATVMVYPGNYSAFESAKADERERKESEIEKREEQIASHQAFVDRFRAKATKARQAQSRIKLIEKIVIEKLPPSSRRYPRFRFRQQRPSGRRVLELSGIGKSYGDNEVLRNVSLTVERGDRLAIIGPNGIGKSTLLKIAVGELKPDSGRVIWGYEASPGYFSQDFGELQSGGKQSIEAWLWEAAPGETIGFIRGQLGNVLFTGDDAEKPVRSLSGGECARLVFARLSVLAPNVLVLDEPTNHLDIEAIDALVTALRAYEGTLIFVSHDRWFVSQLANRILEISPKGLNDFRGTYEEYISRLGDDHLDADAVLQKLRRAKKTLDARKEPEPSRQHRARSLRRRSEELTKEIGDLEARVHAISERFLDPALSGKKAQAEVRKLEDEQKKLQARIGDLMTEWEKVEEELETFAVSA